MMMDDEKLVDAITKIVMERLAADPGCPAPTAVVTFGDVPDCVLGGGLSVRKGVGPADTDGADVIVLTQAAFRAFHGGAIPAGLTGPTSAVASPAQAGVIDLTGIKLINERQVRGVDLNASTVVRVDACAVITPLARDYVSGRGAKFAN